MDYTQPIEIGKEIFWVGTFLPEDSFQCHVYLLRNGNESVLFDPGSLLTFQTTLEKIKKLISPQNIKYLVCHHQDPDITASISKFEQLYPRPDRYIITHWRTHALLKHFAWSSQFWLVDEHDWQLEFTNRLNLEFIFTPYAHFSGSFCTYDRETKILFSSDLFGGFTSKFSLYAEDLSCFEGIRLFHEHYMPSTDILIHTLSAIKKLDIKLIAPQHGYILKENIIHKVINKLETLECGLFKLSKHTKNINFLSKINKFSKELLNIFTDEISFSTLLLNIRKNLKEYFEILRIVIMTSVQDNIIIYDTQSRLKKFTLQSQDIITQYHKWSQLLQQSSSLIIENTIDWLHDAPNRFLIFALKNKRKEIIGLALLVLPSDSNDVFDYGKEIIPFISSILTYFLAKEKEIYQLQEEKEQFYNLAVKDGLTNAYNRFYLKIQIQTLLANALRYHLRLSLIILDIDHFKMVNDIYGHQAGDKILQELSELIQKNLREGDILIRYGGEEFLIILPHTSLKKACNIAERLRTLVESTPFIIFDKTINITISLGVSELSETRQTLEQIIAEADKNLYRAKNAGRNQVVC